MRATTSKYQGDPCVKCGDVEYFASNDCCVTCRRAWFKEYYRKNSRKLTEKNVAYRKRNPDVRRRTRLKRMYGVSLEERDRMFVEQNGRCYLCGNLPGKRTLAVDHCHKSGRIRRLLCIQCNSGLGMFKDDPELLNRAIDYLQETR